MITAARKQRIEHEAHTAAADSPTLNEACPYSFFSAEGLHFAAAFLLALPRADQQAPDTGAQA